MPSSPPWRPTVAEGVERLDDLRGVIDRACKAVSKGDSPEAIAAYIWSNVGPHLEAQRDQARQEVLGEVREILEEEVAASRQFVIYGVNVKQLRGAPLSEREITKGLIVINRGVVTHILDRLATLDPSGEQGKRYTTKQARMALREALVTFGLPQDGTDEEYFIRTAFPDNPAPDND